jgi:SAM-dependent methyltransferase
VSSSWEKYGRAAEGWSDHAYADASAYLARRAELVRTLGPALAAGDLVLDLACGDGGFGDFLPAQRYVGVDASPEMVEAAHVRGRNVVRADLNEYEPPEPAQATTIFRAIYYVSDRRVLLTRIAGYTDKKLVFDLNPRQYRLADVRADLRAAGFDSFVAQPFFVPQTMALPTWAARLLRIAERVELIARVILRSRFTYMCAAFRSGAC